MSVKDNGTPPRPFAGDSMLAAAFFVVADVVLGLFFAASAGSNLSKPLPKHAAPPIDTIVAQARGDDVVLPLIRVMFRRPDDDTLGNVLLGMMVWMPATVAAFAVAIQLVALRHLIDVDSITEQDGRITEYSYKRVVLLFVAAIFLSILWSASDYAFLTHFALVLVFVILLALARWPHLPRRSLIVPTIVFLLSGIAVSITSHRLCITYHGFPPILDIDKSVQARFLSDLRQSMLSPSHARAEDMLDRIQRLPPLNGWTAEANLFAKNRFAADVVVLSALVHLLTMACSFDRLMRGFSISRGFLLSYALGLYLAVGAAFGLLYFNEAVSESGRQNFLSISATVLSASKPAFDRIKNNFEHFGWSDKLEQRIEEARRIASPGMTELLHAALSLHWSSSSVAQDFPQTVRIDGRLISQADLARSHTLADMFYFSFVSFTTTGYGDIRPVSDRIRVWSILENIMELLFTSVFFVVLLGARDTDHSPGEGTGGARAGPAITPLPHSVLLCFAFALLTACTANESLGTNAAASPSEHSCLGNDTSNSTLEAAVIVDDSRSMRGYFEASPPVYPQQLISLMGNLHARTRPSLHALSEGARANTTVADMSRIDYYAQRDTPLERAFRLAADIPRSTAVVIVSDLQQSPTAIEELTSSIRQAVDVRPFVSLHCMLTNYRRKNQQNLRPWYVMIMAHSRQQLTRLKLATEIDSIAYGGSIAQIEARRKHGPLIFESRSFITVESLEWQSGSAFDDGWQLATDLNSDFFQCRTCDRYVKRSVFEQLGQHSGELRFIGRLRSEIPIRNIENLYPRICRADSSRSQCVPLAVSSTNRPPVEIRPVTPPPVLNASALQQLLSQPTRPEGVTSPASPPQDDRLSTSPCPERTIFEERIELTYDLPVIGSETLYQIAFSAGSINLGYPPWVCEYSTRNPNEWQRTPNLEDIVQSIVDASSTDDIFLVHSLVLRRSQP